jgi:isochorismate synthase
VSRLRARRVEVHSVDDDQRTSLQRRAAREGCLHATGDLVVVGIGTACSVPLPGGLAADGLAHRIGRVLDEIALDGDAGPGGSGVVAMGALPFLPDEPTEVVVPSILVAWHPGDPVTWLTEIHPEGAATDPLGSVARLAQHVAPCDPPSAMASQEVHPDDTAFAAALAHCIALLRQGELQKVVLARYVSGRCHAPIDAAALSTALHGFDPTCDLYAYPCAGGRFVGASPELIVATADGAVTAHPLAGTVRLGAGVDDDAQVAWLLASEKNRAEHAVVVDDIVARLTPLCDDLHADDAPTVVRLSTNARLGTWVDGKLTGRRDAATAIGALVALHPTPAVGGLPRAAALDAIAAVEATSRGPWAGPVGWVDADGTSTWTLGLRAVRTEGARFTVWGGAGIVAASEPDDELGEIDEKLASVLRVLGV